MFIKRGGMSSSNLSGSIVLTEKMQCDVLFSSLKLKKKKEKQTERWLLYSGVAELYEWLHHSDTYSVLTMDEVIKL